MNALRHICGAGVALALVLTGQSFTAAAKIIILAHIPVMNIEGLIAAICLKFLKTVKPEILEVPYAS